MRVLIVSAHPNTRSLTQLIAEQASCCLKQAGHELLHFDLYRMGFDPRLGDQIRSDGSVELPEAVREHVEGVRWAEGLIFIYPIWWWERPAILKGWFDQVFFWGFSLQVHNRGHVGLFRDKRALVFQTCGNSKEQLVAQDAQEVLHGSICEGTLELCAVQVDRVETFYSAARLTTERLGELKMRVQELCELWRGR